ncbi:MAG: 3-hydroxyacyl-CoA dehydrogenase family protein [Spirochaetaceae bacterium]|nr:MAG: 3-hydroxyacyl-CoA dehydrogenase family protein [Spirochaetaceae bacterium]
MNVEQIKRIAVVGTGMIGPDISLACAMAGYSVTLVGRSDLSVARGLERFRKNLRSLVRAEVYGDQEAAAIEIQLNTSTDLESGLQRVDFVIEAIIEDLQSKQELFFKIEERCPDYALMASSTSGLSPTDISSRMRSPDRMLVMHFWNPPYLVPLVEVVAGDGTSRDTVAAALDFLRILGKEPVLLKKDILGHIGNRIQHAMFREAIHLVEEGVATPEDIDRVIMSSLGPRYSMIGPMEYLDSVGLDLNMAIHSYLLKELADDKEPQRALRNKYDQGHYGAKTGRGFYDWSTKNLEEMIVRQNKRFIDRLIDLRRK